MYNHLLMVCDNFVDEIASLNLDSDFEGIVTASFPAHCGIPSISSSKLTDVIREYDGAYTCCDVFSGSCIYTNDGVNLQDCTLTRLPQCFYLFANHKIIDGYLEKGAYLLTPGWLGKWRDKIGAMGFDQEQAREFYGESIKRLTLLNTGVGVDTYDNFSDFANFLNLPTDVVPVGTEYFRLFLTNFILQRKLSVNEKRNKKDLLHEREKSSGYATAIDLLNTLALTKNEPKVIRHIMDVFKMLFSPGKLFFLPLYNGKPGEIISAQDSKSFNTNIAESLAVFNKEYQHTLSGAGFRLSLKNRDEVLAVMEIDDIAFPQYLEPYLNMALNIVNVCAMALDNARVYEKLYMQNAEIVAQNNHLQETLDELRLTQQQLIEAEKMAYLGNLVAEVAHEINTPVGVGITAASGLTEKTKTLDGLFGEKKMKRSDLESYLLFADKAGALILNNLQRTAELVKSFKQVAVDQACEEKRRFHFRSHIQKIIDSLEPKLNSKNIMINLDCEEQIEIESCPGLYAKIFSNLLLNSFIHGFSGRDKGYINIDVEFVNNTLHISYRDNGCGIPEDFLPRIFDPFFTTDKQTGSGLGMHIVYNIIIQKLNGVINCNSEQGKGVLFNINIPMSEI